MNLSYIRLIKDEFTRKHTKAATENSLEDVEHSGLENQIAWEHQF